MKIFLVTTCAVIALAGMAQAQQKPALSDDAYMKRVMTAAPPQVVEQATIVRMDNSGGMRTMKKGTSVWTCMADEASEGNGAPMCLDANAMEWLNALMSHGPAPQKTGFVYMLAGDDGSANKDPYAEKKTADNHWVVTGPHVMIVGPAAATLGYPRTADPDPTKPYVMFPGSPYEHVMIPMK